MTFPHNSDFIFSIQNKILMDIKYDLFNVLFINIDPQ